MRKIGLNNNTIIYPLISVVVPIYNMECYLPRCLDSIKKQSYPNLEVILVNDGSSDGSGRICQKYVNNNNWKYLEKPNGGLSDARNFGLNYAHGEYIGFVDSDDYIDSEMYLQLYNDLVKTGADISSVGFKEFSDNDDCYHKDCTNEKAEVYEKKEAVKLLFFKDKYANYAWNKLYKAELFEKIRYPIGRNMEDLGTTYKLFLLAEKVSYNSRILYYYYQRPESIVHSAKPGFYEDKLEMSLGRFLDIREQYPYLIENDMFYFDAICECLPYCNKESELYRETIKSVRLISRTILGKISKNRKIKYYMLLFFPNIFYSLFRRQYGN